MFLVICMDRNPDTDHLEYHLATRTVFVDERTADWYKSTIAEGRLPIVVHYDGKPLRHDSKERFGKLIHG